ncbi:MAG TPA: MBOAT family O-acyltransferase [Chitinophaga sp.]|uniref:MBOAT family O-acyltransferase n=1 Tax=Chitinophaga sp. TaxID=1869181 RepID=UPI002DB706FE|nr:MBOAT family O-acyltransferase [Chitinophaga sp.]HEU4552166.1 MBOAT family O-acyltransferase [Chitinophaga sp.]
MIFNSYTFIVFFVIVLVLHNLPFSWKTKKVNLLAASYIFYAAWNPPFILLLWLSTIVDYFVGKALYTQNNIHKRRGLLVISLIGNLGMLCFFKYGGFLMENFVSVVNALGWSYHPPKSNIILPAGISFYTFTTLCYTIDMYKRESKPIPTLLDFGLFVTFFPHLVAGPIVRPPQLAAQFEQPRTATHKQLLDGLFLLSLGLFMKVVLADGMLAASADAVFNTPQALTALDAWMGVLAFTGQIFFDFAGYSMCAVGAALSLGFTLPQNFQTPYAATGFSDFWRRWHITLSAWLRDYLYIPLGGNRKGKFRTYVNLMITMLLGGLWHGANWTFVAWGGLHGLYLWVEKFFEDRKNSRLAAAAPASNPQLPKAYRGILYALLTFFLVNITWVFFRATTFAGAGKILTAMAGLAQGAVPLLSSLAILKVAVVIAGMLIVHWVLRNTKVIDAAYKLPWWITGTVWSAMLILLILSQESSSTFIYFQF